MNKSSRNHYTFQRGHRNFDFGRQLKFIKWLLTWNSTKGLILSEARILEIARYVYEVKQPKQSMLNNVKYMFKDCKAYTQMMKQDPYGDGLYYPQYDEMNEWMNTVGVHASESTGLSLSLKK